MDSEQKKTILNKIRNEYDKINPLQYDLEKIISINAEILQSIYDSKPKLEDGEDYLHFKKHS